MMRRHYEENRQKYLDKASIRRPIAAKAARDHVCAYLLGHPCADCGESDLVVLQFDHCRGEPKKANIADMVRDGLRIRTIQAEIDKCDVVCANCHMRRTARRNGWWSINFSSYSETDITTDYGSVIGGSNPSGSAQ